METNNIQRLIILQGLPGSGKSTWAREFIKGKRDWAIVNRDSLRNMRGDYWIVQQEGLITKWEDYCIASAVSEGLNVIIDATNFNPKTLAKWHRIASANSLEAEIMTFDTPVEECIRRDLGREKPVGKSVIWGMYKKYINPDN